MIEALVKKEEGKKITQTVPSYLIREEIDHIPYYYKGYKSVLNNEKKIEDIMGSSGLQALVIEVLMNYLFLKIGRDKYRFLTNEVGGHIKKGTNLSFDLAIYSKETLPINKINEFYVNVPPKAVIEIDVKIEVENQHSMDYITTKTEKLLEYGCEQVLWVLTKSKKVIVAASNSQWKIINWEVNIDFLDGNTLNIGELLAAEGLK